MVDNNKEIPKDKLKEMHSQKDLDEVSNNLDKMFKNEEEDDENRQNLLEISNQLKLNMQMSNNDNEKNKNLFGETPMNTQEVINYFLFIKYIV